MEESMLSSIIGETLKSCYVHPVTFKIVFKDLDVELMRECIDRFNEDQDEDEDVDLEEGYKKVGFIYNLTWDTLVFDPSITKLEIYTEDNGNTDNRGGGCGNLNIPVEEFRYTINNDKGITLRDVTEAVYRMKGSKYDYWYELYTGIQVVNKTSDSVLIKVEFDYGS